MPGTFPLQVTTGVVGAVAVVAVIVKVIKLLLCSNGDAPISVVAGTRAGVSNSCGVLKSSRGELT